MEGYQILRLLLEFGQRPKKVVLVTSNPVAKQTMRNDLLDLGYKENPNRIEYDWQE
ncbi:ORF079 [Escherichia phage T5]|uniref:ORF079 n=2 Tax=Tequintavirus TaxID=187218 RepID=Q5DML5_BPT5|nr:ORF079 [Escherichia phage T5]